MLSCRFRNVAFLNPGLRHPPPHQRRQHAQRRRHRHHPERPAEPGDQPVEGGRVDLGERAVEHVAAQGGPLPQPVDVTGTRRTRPTEPPRALAAELSELELQLHYARRAAEAANRSVRELESLIRAKAGKL